MTEFSSKRAVLVAAALVAVTTAACERVKTSNPLAPTVAGPMAGVEITPPKLLQPSIGRSVLDTEQPLAVVIENPASNSPRPFTIAFEIATDNQFSNIIFAQNGMAPGPNGQTRFTLPIRLPPGRTYYWHLRADDGANTSGWSPASYFQILQPIVVGAPRPSAPVGNVRVTTMTPELVADNGASSGPHGVLSVHFQVAVDQAFGTLVANTFVTQGSGQTRYVTPSLPGNDRTFFWRARTTDGTNTSGWSVVESFRSPVGSGPGPGPGPTPPGSGGPPSVCASGSGSAVVSCIASRYPQYLAAGVSHNQRVANMEFLRDRIIESARCGGMDVSWNLKRGVGPLSTDAVAWRVNGRDEVVDIGVAFDDTSQPLQLTWGIVAGPPGYTPYPSFSCGG